MKMFKESSMVKRVLASFMAFLMVISLMPSMGHVFAAATEHPGYVTIMVVDGESNPIQGANVDYSIMKDPSVTDGDAFTTINSTGTTDEYGVVEVLDATQYIDGCLLISATVSKTGYDNATISSTAISSSEANFSVQLSKTVTMPDIENVTITTLDADYTGQEQELITSVDTDTEGATIEYSTDNSTWSEQIPKETDVAEYSVYVRITKDGYNTYESGEKIAKINAIDIPDIDITAKQFNYVENTSQELVTLTGNFEDTDTVTWSVNNTATGDRSIPTGLAAGSYTVKLEINRGSNYKPFTKEVTSTILNAELNLDGLSVTGLDGTYTGNPQDAVTVSNQGSYDLKYQLDDGDLAVDNNAWSNDIPTVTNAGSYIVWVKAVKANYNDKDVEVTPTFSASVKYGEMQDAEAQDQGIGDRIIYLKHIETGEITEKIVTSVNKLDNEKPYNVGIEFPEATEKDDVKYYGDEITVTFTAYDNTSGVSKFNWEYTRADGSSTSILEADSGTVEAIRDSHDSTKYVGTLTLPRNQAEQLRGNLKVSATDVADNTCDSYTDTGVFVVDTIAPTQTVSYQLKDGVGTTQTVDTKHYFSNDVVLTFDIVEANFFASDVKIFVSKNGGANQLQTLSWETTENIDENEAKLTLSEDGDYVISMSYEDRSGKVMTSYISDTVVVDKTIPVLEFDYKDYTDTENPQSAIVTITEHNFRASDIEFDVITKNIAGQSVIGNDLQQYLRNLDWTSNGDVHTATISGEFVDAIYDLTFNYKDLALNAAAEIKPEQFIVDRTAPDIAKMSVAYSNPLVDTILSAITFGYYKPTVNVTFTGYDNTAGIDYFTWSYKKENGASNSNVAEYADAKIAAVQDNTDKTKFTATVTLPKETAEQLRGSIAFVSTDKYNNSSNKLTDDNHVIVVDTIAPTMSAEYTTADNTHGEKDYYKKDLTATFTVTEANFYPEDVKIQLKKNDNDVIDITPVWTDVSTDVHVGTYTIDANDDHSNDGDYVFQVEYKDRSNNEMTSYTSGVKVIDTTKPVINVEYSNSNVINELTDTENHTRKYFASAQTATITINEHNFNPGDVNYTIVAKDVAGNELNASSLYTTSSWTSNGDNNIVTITYPGDANYTFDIAYTDLATIEADDFAEQYFTVDTSKPSDLKVTYSTSLLDTVLNAITFGFYNAKATVTISATDNITGIYSMKYSYVKADGVSGVNTELVDATIDASSITNSNGGAVGTTTFEIPRSALAPDSQFNGTVNFTAIDRANNESDYLRDTKRIIVDNIAPNAEVQYNTPVQVANGVSYYDGDITAKAVVKAQYNNARSSSSRAKYWNRLEKIKLQKTLGTIKYGIIETGKTIIDEIKNEIYRDEVNEDIVEEIDKKISCSVY